MDNLKLPTPASTGETLHVVKGAFYFLFYFGGWRNTYLSYLTHSLTTRTLNVDNIFRIRTWSCEMILIRSEMITAVSQTEQTQAMSVDRKKISDTLRLGVDEWHEFPCSPCARMDRNIAATKYCVECNENLCSTCLKDHNKFAIMRVHQITDNLSSRTRQGQELPTQRCDRHGGKLIDVYCSNHDVVGCSMCFILEHGSCEGIQYIPDMTAGMQQSEEISDLETKLKQLLARLDHITQQKQDDLKLLQQEMDKLLKEIQVLRKRVNDKLDEMEQTLVNEVNTKLGLRTRDISKALDVINNERSSLEERQKSLQSAKRINKTEQFVQLKMGQSLVQEHERMFKRINTGATVVNMQVLPSSGIKTLLQADDAALGSISEIFIPKSATYARVVDVRLKSDKKICDITDICLTSNGDIYIADNSNCRIKKLNDSYTVIEHFDLSCYPGGLCEVDNKRLAVTLSEKKKVQILSQNPMSLGESFTVGEHCRGIDFHNGQLYVCCGGWRKEREGLGRIEVYSMGGELLRVYYKGASFPWYVNVSVRGDLLISNSNSESLFTLRIHDHSVSNLQINGLARPAEMFRLSDNLLCVVGTESNNIVLISEDGEQRQELLTEKDGISNPHAVCFVRKHSHLIVSFCKSSYIKIFKVTT